uniref:Uncharacterized protein n=1 Tax=Panagrolaimus sp. ES5 TaxID=591445 RepID=A0AC34G333_9BILA
MDSNVSMIADENGNAFSLKTCDDNSIILTFQKYPQGLTWNEFTDAYIKYHGVLFAETEKKKVEAKLATVAGIEAFELGPIKVFNLVDKLESSYLLKCSLVEGLSPYDSDASSSN